MEKEIPRTTDAPDDVIELLKNRILTNTEYLETPFAKFETGRTYNYEIENGSKSIFYFGTSHINDPGDPLFLEIEKSMRGFKPQIVMIEGWSSINSKKDMVVEGMSGASLEDLKKEGEPSFALKLAVELGSDFESPEPKFSDEVLYLEQKGFSHKDIFSYYIYRDVEQYQRQNERRSVEDFTRYIEPFLNEFRNELVWPETEVDALEREFFAELNIDDHDFYESRVHPLPLEDGKWRNITNEISSSSGDFRDNYGFERIATALKKYNRVFVIYGSSHAVRLEPALRELLSDKINL